MASRFKPRRPPKPPRDIPPPVVAQTAKPSAGQLRTRGNRPLLTLNYRKRATIDGIAALPAPGTPPPGATIDGAAQIAVAGFAAWFALTAWAARVMH